MFEFIRRWQQALESLKAHEGTVLVIWSEQGTASIVTRTYADTLAYGSREPLYLTDITATVNHNSAQALVKRNLVREIRSVWGWSEILNRDLLVCRIYELPPRSHETTPLGELSPEDQERVVSKAFKQLEAELQRNAPAIEAIINSEG